MPATEVARKQRTLGGAAGLALLAFALIYRFFPGLLHVEAPVEPPATAMQQGTAGATRTWSALEASGTGPPGGDAAAPAGLVGTSLADALRMGPPLAPSEAVAALLGKAHQAESEGKLVEPADANAIALYREVLAAAPENPDAEAGLARIGGALRDWALAAIERGDEGSARRYLDAYAGLPHSERELAQVRERVATLQQVRPLLTRAAELMKAGRITLPKGGNALEIYRQIMELDPGNRLADAGLAVIERRYLDRALAESARDEFGKADASLAEAAAIRPGSQELLETRTRIEGLRRQRAESVLAQARSALDAGNADLADQLVQRAQAISADLAGLDEFSLRLRNARLYANLSPGQVVRDPFVDLAGSAPAVVVIPAGGFEMGVPADAEGAAASETPRREVAVALGFALGQREVTVGQFREFVNASGYVSDAEKLGGSAVYEESSGRMVERRGTNWRNDYAGARARDDLPVVHVSWNDASAYAAWLAAHTGKRYRLPSEAEYEYALRAGSSSRFPWGEGTPDMVVGNFTGSGDRSPSKRSWSLAFAGYGDGFWGPAPVGSFPANPFGLHDMDGNVSEWVQDCWHENFLRAPRDSSAWMNPGCRMHVVRGGSWGSDPEQVRSTYRVPAAADARNARVGFRVARDL